MIKHINAENLFRAFAGLLTLWWFATSSLMPVQWKSPQDFFQQIFFKSLHNEPVSWCGPLHSLPTSDNSSGANQVSHECFLCLGSALPFDAKKTTFLPNDSYFSQKVVFPQPLFIQKETNFSPLIPRAPPES